MKTVKPSSNFIFAKPTEKQRETKSGILLTERQAEAPLTAEVINIGSNVKEFVAHDIIYYKSYATNDIKLDNDDFILIAEEDVLGKVIEV